MQLIASTPVPATVVEEEYSATLTPCFDLGQNFPNPFNSRTMIRFTLPTLGVAELAIYSFIG